MVHVLIGIACQAHTFGAIRTTLESTPQATISLLLLFTNLPWGISLTINCLEPATITKATQDVRSFPPWSDAPRCATCSYRLNVVVGAQRLTLRRSDPSRSDDYQNNGSPWFDALQNLHWEVLQCVFQSIQFHGPMPAERSCAPSDSIEQWDR